MTMKCDICELVKEDVGYYADPFLAEVYPEDYPDGLPYYWYCDDCYADRHDEV